MIKPSCVAETMVQTVLDMDVPQVSLKLVFRGEELPRLHSIHFISGSETSVAEALQDRDLTKAVAVTLLLFRSYSDHRELTLFRIKAAKPASFINTILNAKKQSQSKSPVCGLANGAFLRLFLKSCTPTSRYIDIDLARLKPNAIEIFLDGRTVSDTEIVKQMINIIAARKSWEIKDYSIEARPHPEDSRPAALDQRSLAIAPARTQPAASQGLLDNPAFIAIREAVRNFCQDGVHEHLHVRHIQSTAELEDLWEIDNAAYGQASITYEKFKNWWLSFPSGLNALFFRTRVMGAIGIWPLSDRCAELFASGRLKESEINGRTMRTFLHSAGQFWYISGIVLRPELRGGRAITILLSQCIGSWLATAHVRFPCQLLALAYSEQGQALLEGFDFFKLRNAKTMPDGVPLFALKVSAREHLLLSLKSRGLDLCPPADKALN